MLQLPHRRALLGGARYPSWLPLGTGNVAPLLFADFAAGNYWYNGLIYVSFASFMTAIGGTFSRASSATYFDSAGVLQTAGNNVARFVYDPVSHASLGLRLTGARTNLNLWSEQFDNAAYTKVDITITANALAAPDGTTTADLVTEGSAGTSAIDQSATISANGTYSCSVSLKRGNSDWVFLVFYQASNSANICRAWFNLNTGAVGSVTNGGTASGAAAKITSLSNGWFRCTLTGAINNSATDATFGSRSASGDASTTRVNGATRYQWGAQLELGSFASDYIATTSASATEAADSLIIGPTGGVPFTGFNASAGTILANWSPHQNTIGFQGGIWSINDGSSSNRIDLRASTAGNGTILTRAGSGTTLTLSGFTTGLSYKTALSVQAGDRAISINGAAVLTDSPAAMPNSLSKMNIGDLDTGSGQEPFTNINTLAYWPSRLSNADLQRLST